MIIGCFVASWFEIFNLPVFWPVLVVYWLILFSLTSELHRPLSAAPFCAIRESTLLTSMVYQVRRQIQHMIKYRYVPFSIGKAKYSGRSS